MKKEDKEKLIYNSRLKEIELMDKDYTSFSLKLLFLWFASVAYFYKTGFNSIIIFVLVSVLVSILWFQYQTYNYLTDCYNWITLVVKNDKLLTSKVPEIKWYEGIYYRKRYS
jgi:hypothetical protein